MHEVRGLVAFEGCHELLVVDAKGVWRVVVDRRELIPSDAYVLVHRALAIVFGKRVPAPDLDERGDDQVRRALRCDLARPPAGRVPRGLCRGEIVVRRLQPGRERGRVERGAELPEILVALGDLPEEEVLLRPDAGG